MIWPKRATHDLKKAFCTIFMESAQFSCFALFQASVTILRTFMVKNEIWPERGSDDLKRPFCTISMKSALFSLFGENFRPV